MATPYWGQLPGPKIVTNQRIVDDDGPSLLDTAFAGSNHQQTQNPKQNSSKLNRASVQTNVIEATDTTLGPLVSPTNSSFAPHGLAPRPPSYQRQPLGAEDPDAGPSTRRSRRRSRNPDEADFELREHKTASSEARGPPLSYRASDSRRPSQPIAGPPPEGRAMEYEESYAPRHDTSYQNYGDVGAFTDPSRKASVGGPSDRRRKSAVNKSPLQRLELTLDSMTKEEKRARVEAAEQRARDRAARKAGEMPIAQVPTYQPAPSHPEAQSRRPSAAYPESSAAPAVAPAHAPAPIAREIPIEREAPRETEPLPSQIPIRRHTQVEDRPYQAEAPRSREPSYAPPMSDHTAGLPKRNLSFRERAARDELSLPLQDDTVPQPTRQPMADSSGRGGFSLTRNGSNKLKKDPPTEASYHARAQAAPLVSTAISEQRLPVQTSRRVEQPRALDKDLPPAPQEARRPSGAHDLRAFAPADDIQGLQRRATEPISRKPAEEQGYFPPMQQIATSRAEMVAGTAPQDAAAMRRKLDRRDSDSSDNSHQHRISNMLYKGKEGFQPGNGLYYPPEWLEEWRKAPTGILSGPLLNMVKEQQPAVVTDDNSKAWWEGGGRRSSYSYTNKPAKPEASDDQYDGIDGPTRYKPQLYVECGPLLRYTGLRHEKVPTRTRGVVADKDFWRGSIMIVTRDSDSAYEIPPMLRLFVQDLELLPTPPHHINGDLSPEYVDPITGHPKAGPNGETLFVRPVEHLEEGKDLSLDDTDNGLFEASRSASDDGPADYPGSFASRLKRANVDGEKLNKYKDVRGFRLHAERGCTFWRFNIEVELRDQQQRIAYRINRGPCNAFWVPSRVQPMNIMFHSCNGFSMGAKPDAMSGPDPMWRDVLNSHQTSPFHVMIGGGDQIFNDEVADECTLFIDWLETRNPFHKRNAPFTQHLQDQLEDFYFERYCEWFSHGLFSLANAQIPMVNTWSDRESFNGFGSYPHRDMDSPVLSGVGSVAFKYYMLFQHQSIIPETEETEPSWILGAEPGPYINELSRNIYVSLGSKLALLSTDLRTERTEDDVIDDKTWEKIMNRLYAEVRRGQVEHLLVVLPVPIAYPRLAWLESILTSKAMNPIKALGKKGLLGKSLHNIEGGSEVMDDLKDHWTGKNHKQERSIIIEDLQDLAIDKSVRVTILSGDVNMAAVGQFYSNPKLNLLKHNDPRYMPNIISSAIVNAPPPDILADALNKRHKIHHFDSQTDEAMIPIFQHGVDGKPRNNKRLLPHRNWCSIRQWVPGTTPPPTPPPVERSQSPPRGGLLRRLSLGGSSDRPDLASRESVRGPRPPVSGGGGLFRSLSRTLSRRNSTGGDRPGVLTRTLSLGRGGSNKPAANEGGNEKRGLFSFGRRNSSTRPHNGDHNGQWEAESEDDYDDIPHPREHGWSQPVGLRGGAVHDEYSDGDEEYFTARPPQRAQTMGAVPTRASEEIPPQALRPFHRTPTGLSVKQKRKAETFEVDLEGGLDICLNVEVNPRDPTGITVPYRILVPKLFYEYTPEVDVLPPSEPTGIKKFLSFRKKEKAPPAQLARDEEDEQFDDHEDERRYQPAQQY